MRVVGLRVSVWLWRPSYSWIMDILKVQTVSVSYCIIVIFPFSGKTAAIFKVREQVFFKHRKSGSSHPLIFRVWYPTRLLDAQGTYTLVSCHLCMCFFFNFNGDSISRLLGVGKREEREREKRRGERCRCWESARDSTRTVCA